MTSDGRPFLALGSPGGATIITTVLQILLDRLDLGMTLPQAIAEPRASQRNTLTRRRSQGSGPRRARRHSRLAATTSSRTREIGAATAIEFLPGGGVLAAAEPVRRGGGSAMVEVPSG